MSGLAVRATPGRTPAVVTARAGRRRPSAVLVGLLVPALVLTGGLIVYPMVSSVLLSLHSPRTGAFVGLANYRRFLADPQAGPLVAHTYARAILGVVPSYLVGLLIALAVTRGARFTRVFTLVALLPFVISPPVAIGMWQLLLDSQTGALAGLGVSSVDVFTSSDLVWPVLIYINTWGSFQLYTMILIAALRRIPLELYESAALDGAGRWQKFRFVTLPGIARVSLAVCTVHFIASFQEFNLIYLATGGGPLGQTQTMATYAYLSAFTNSDMNYATALTTTSTGLMALTLLGLAVLVRGVRAGLDLRQRRVAGHPAPRTTGALDLPPPTVRRRRARPGRMSQRTGWRYVGLAVIALYAVGPILFLLSVSLDATPGGAQPIRIWPRDLSVANYQAVLTNPDLWSNTNIALPPLALNFLNSILVTLGTTALVVVAGALGGFALTRVRATVNRGLVGFFLLLQLVPLIVLVFPLYELLARLGILGSQAGLILASTVISLPMSVLFFHVFFSDLPPEVFEAATMDGAGTLRSLFAIALPLSKPALGAVAAFALINTWNEFLLGTTLISYSRLRTLPPALDQYMSSYAFAASASPGMQAIYFLIPIAAAVVLLSLTQRHLTSAYEGGGVKG